MRMNDQEPVRASEGLSFKSWFQIVVALVIIGFLTPVIIYILPVIKAWSSTIGFVVVWTLIICIPGLLAVAAFHMWSNHKLKHFQAHIIKPNANNAYGAVYVEAEKSFVQAKEIAPPHVVPEHLHYSPTIRNDAREIARMLEGYRGTHIEEVAEELAPPVLPNYVDYDRVRPLIPPGHALVGVTGEGIETKDDYIRALLWIVGGSGSGKTNSTVIRIDDDARRGHQFLGVDPHAFKSDSLTNALRGYAHLFRMPIARDLEDIEAVLDAFLTEFRGRKGENWPCYPPITLVVDEVSSLTMDVDKSDPVAVRVADKLKQIARICGQESRDFNMVGIYITQNAAGMAWLRRYAVMVLAHQVVQFSERLLVCNQEREIARDMDNWPKGRTYVYGIAFEDGPLLVQQPVVKTRIVEADAPTMPDLPRRQTSSHIFPQAQRQDAGRWQGGAQEATGRQNDEEIFSPITLKKFLNEAGKKRANGASIDGILKEYGLAPGGRNNQNLKALLDGTTGLEEE